MDRRRTRTLSIAMTLLGLASPLLARASEDPGGAVEDAALLTLEGRRTTLFAHHDEDVLVVAYTGVGCPVSGKYAPRLERLSKRYAERGVRFVGIDACPQDSRVEIAKECEELGLSFPVFQDFRQELTRELDARTTTEVFVVDRERRVRYRGAVDDQYSVGASRPEPRTHYLVDALDAVLAGRDPEVAKSDAPGCILTREPQQELPATVTWTEHVAPIVQDRCQVCHRPGQVGPFSLLTYDDAKGWAAMIRSVVNEERMPPWNADAHFDGLFVNERRLTDFEKRVVNQWVKSGMPKGDESLEPEPRTWPEEWRIGEPDAIFAMEEELVSDGGQLQWVPLEGEGFEVPREGVVDYRYFQVRTSFAEDKWIQRMEARPGAADVVHHVLVYVADGDSRRLGPPGGGVGGYFCVAVPGDTPSVFPEGYAKRLPAGATLRFQMHYTPNGKQRFDRSSLGVVFADGPPEHEVETASVAQQRFVIPAGAAYHEVEAVERIPADIRILAYFPHMHTRGKDFEYLATFPDGSEESLLFSHFDFNWQENYQLSEPIHVPRGTVISCVGHFDNSADNPNNPDPTIPVSWGDQTFEEMFIGYFDYVVDRGSR